MSILSMNVYLLCHDLLTILLNLAVWFLARSRLWSGSAWLFTPLLVIWAGCPLIAIGLIAELIIAEHPRADVYEITERAGWCAEQEA